MLKSAIETRCNTFLNFMFNIVIMARKLKMALRKHEVKTFKGTDCRVIGRKLAGSLTFPFLWMRIVQAFFHSLGTNPVDQAVRIISDK